MNGEDGDAMREALEKLKTSSMEIGKAVYSQANNQSTEQSSDSQQQ
jgi:hypothetical protein